MHTLTFRVTGLVQGVWFRGWVQMTAQGLGLRGWVRNLPDGSVAGQAQAADDSRQGRAALERFTELLHVGPPSARVARVEAETADLPEVFDGFNVRR
ncbi:MAG: acylphosphatase [Humidesulfovibrio sp.]|jgi:acylphosphatase|uniref:acylphosphatase n=1 Tax=Humidesulfovibrio sp. TaxID=2910988 RepID=UPI00273701EC|nr:acylphosphatase [Humidesulfovibrio sp.]MDP2847532.1 acylphosphatase [Humidesulfovibrio sp.]